MPRILKGHKENLNVKRRLRREMTPAEMRLWTRLRLKQFYGLKFRRQHGIGPYIVDFYCPAKSLVIEIDGDIHTSKNQICKDRLREEFLKSLNLTAVRYSNDDILKNLEGVLEDLAQRLSL